MTARPSDRVIDAATESSRVDRGTVAHVWGHHGDKLARSEYPLHYACGMAETMLVNLSVAPADEVPQRCEEIRAVLALGFAVES